MYKIDAHDNIDMNVCFKSINNILLYLFFKCKLIQLSIKFLLNSYAFQSSECIHSIIGHHGK